VLIVRRILIVGKKLANFPCIPWTNWDFSDALDYQALVLDCRVATDLPTFSIVAQRLRTYVANGHPVYVLLPEASSVPRHQALQMDHFPGVQLFVRAASGQTLQLRSSEPFFQSYIKILKRYEVYFDVRATDRAAWVDGIVDNVSQNICGKFGSIYFLHPPEPKSELLAFKIIIEHFGPDPPLSSNEPRPSWVDAAAASLPGLAELQSKIGEIEKRIRNENDTLETEREKAQHLAAWADLLWLDGIPLQIKVCEALKLLGVPVEATSLTGHLGDLTADVAGIHFVFEVTGSTGSIGIEKGRQLMQWIVDSPDPIKSKGVLVANAFRNVPPDERPPTPNHKIFVNEVESLAKRFGLALLDIRELYRVLCLKLAGKQVEVAEVIQDLQTSGSVRFRAA
jgi:hypothetical protein